MKGFQFRLLPGFLLAFSLSFCAQFEGEQLPLSWFVGYVPPGWWDTGYLYRRRIMFGDNHSLLPGGYTARFMADTGNAFCGGGEDLRIIFHMHEGGVRDIQRAAPTRAGGDWRQGVTKIDFSLWADVGENQNESTKGEYYVYYGARSECEGTGPPVNEKEIYYFAEFFESGIGDGVTYNDGGGVGLSVAGGELLVPGNNKYPSDAGVIFDLPDGPIEGDFSLEFQITLRRNAEEFWCHSLVMGDSGLLDNNARYTGAGPGIFFGESDPASSSNGYFRDQGENNVNNRVCNDRGNCAGGVLAQTMENLPDSALERPLAIRLEVKRATKTIDYYRDDILVAQGLPFAGPENNLDRIRIATDNYFSAEPAFRYDSLRIRKPVDAEPQLVLGSEETILPLILTF